MQSPEDGSPPPGDAPPLAIRGSTAATVQAALITVMLACVTISGAIASLLSFWKTRDLASAIVWLRGSEALQAISAITLLAGVGGMIARTVRRKWREIYLARHAPNNVAYIVGEQKPPHLDSRVQSGNDGRSTRLVDGAILHRGGNHLSGRVTESWPPASMPPADGDS